MEKVYNNKGEREEIRTDATAHSRKIAFKPNSFQGVNDNSFLAHTFLQRLDSLNALVQRRSSLSFQRVFSDPQQEDAGNVHQQSVSQVLNAVNTNENSSAPSHSLAMRDPNLPMTDAGRRLEILFDRYRAESAEDPKVTKLKKHRGLNRVQIQRGERRKKSIQTLQNQLNGISTRHLSRSANTLQFRVKNKADKITHRRAQSDEVANGDFPIAVNEHEMNPSLLLALSCEKLAIDRGNRMLKTVVLHDISQKLFVFMYWFIHCRFFQKNSSSEQRHLLTKVAIVFPKFINMLTESVSSVQRDVIFRCYPFVLSKAIFLGFSFLCPGNTNLFKGAFQGILYLSIFRLLTGLDICPGSIEALRHKLYPEDFIEDSPSDEKDDNELRPMIHSKTNSNNFSSITSKESEHKVPANQQTLPMTGHRDSVVKFVGDRESLRFRPDKPEFLGPTVLRHQNMVQFDTQQLSPLLSQCLRRESKSMGIKHFVKRTEPVSYCKSGGVETYHSISDTNTISNEDSRMKTYQAKTRELKMESMKAKFEHRKVMKELARKREKILSGKKKIQSFAASIMDGLK